MDFKFATWRLSMSSVNREFENLLELKLSVPVEVQMLYGQARNICSNSRHLETIHLLNQRSVL